MFKYSYIVFLFTIDPENKMKLKMALYFNKLSKATVCHFQ